MHGDQRARHISRLKLLTHAGSLSSLSHDALYQPCLWVEEDVAEAVKWYRKAAEQGDKDAQHNLGVCYEYGEGVEQD